MTDAVTEIKSRLTIEDLVAQYVVLKRMGANLKGLCPFHSEKTPSFVVSPERGIAYCFGCHKGGDIFKFLQEVEGIDFSEALKLLADRTGVELESKKYAKKILKNEKADLFEIHEEATSFYEKKLWDSVDGMKVLEYLKKRGLTEETIKKFRLGFSPDSFEETYTILLKKGFDKKAIILSGLALAKDTTLGQIYDRFRGRLMFPITDNMGRIVAFGGRALKNDQEPKYLNSPETPIYQKSNILYGFSFTKQEIKSSQKVVIVEGYMDLLAAYQNGLKEVVAVSGTALTERHLHLLKSYAKELVLAFDMDNAGQEAAKRAYELTLSFDYEVKVMALSEGKDIAEFAKEHGQELLSLRDKAEFFTDYFYQQLVGKHNFELLQDRKKFLQEFLVFFQRLHSNLEKDEYVRKVASKLNLTESQVYDEVKRSKLLKNHLARDAREDAHEDHALKLDTQYQPEELIIGLMLEFPSLSQKFKDLIKNDFFSPPLNAIYNAFWAQYNPSGVEYLEKEGQKLKVDFADLDYDLIEKASLLSLYVSEKYKNLSEILIEKELNGLFSKVLNHKLMEQKRELQKRILEAEKTGDIRKMQQLLQDLNALHLNK